MSDTNLLDENVDASKTAGSSHLSHSEMKEVFREALKTLLGKDPILCDLHCDITHHEVQSLHETEVGRSILVTVLRDDDKEISVRVPRDSRVHALKTALKTKFSLDMHRSGDSKKISWKSVWRRYHLYNPHSDITLSSDNALLEDVGVTHKSLLTFKPRRRCKGHRKKGGVP